MTYNLFDDLGRPLWQKEGACRPPEDSTPEELSAWLNVFFPERGQSTKEAKSVCAFCPVNQQCLDYALMNGEKNGIWGGTSERERRKIRKERTKKDPEWRRKLKEYYGLRHGSKEQR